MEYFFLFSVLITLAAVFSFFNVKVLKLPSGISLMLMGTVASISLILVGKLSDDFTDSVRNSLSAIDFSKFILGILLSFLLFAGSLHVKIDDVKKSLKTIITFSTFGTFISTFLIGVIIWYILPLFHIEAPLILCLLFGALISPTDPIAVIGILKKANISKSIETKITGESLFNDGVGVVIFATLLEISKLGMESFEISSALLLFVQEAFGGIVAGAIIGFAGYMMMKSIDNFQTEIMISLAMVMGGYSLCHYLHVSGPLAMVIAGLVTGNIGSKKAMSDVTRDYMVKFWEVTDEILNALLFMLIGLEIMIVDFKVDFLLLGLITAIILVIVRYISLWIPSFIFRLQKEFEENTLRIMSWGGLRGGISIALALSLPSGPEKDVFVAMTFVVVLFSILVQGFSIGNFIRYLSKIKN